MNTPWGISDSWETLAPGIISYSTPSHCGIWLSAERQAQLPKGIDNFLHDLRWWEEDSDWSVPYIIFKDDIEKHGQAYHFIENLNKAYIIARQFHPEVIEVTAVKPEPAPTKDTETLAHVIVDIVDSHTDANIDQDGEAVYNIDYYHAIEQVKTMLDSQPDS